MDRYAIRCDDRWRQIQVSGASRDGAGTRLERSRTHDVPFDRPQTGQRDGKASGRSRQPQKRTIAQLRQDARLKARPAVLVLLPCLSIERLGAVNSKFITDEPIVVLVRRLGGKRKVT